MDNGYAYDAVSNVLSVANKAALPESGKAGGQMAHAYTYDALYRLASATGTYAGADSKTASYRLEMGYDNMHRIVSKKQHLTQQGVQFDGTLHVGYDLAYTYGKTEGKKFQLAEVKDANYRTEENPDSVAKIDNNHTYTYDANGNLVYVNTGRIKQDGMLDSNAAERKLRWDEENRQTASDDNGFVTNYWYDADGERTVKTSGEGEQLYVNSEFAGGRTNTAKFSLYVSPYLVANQGGRYTKHIYIGSQRIVSKIGDFDSYGSDPRRIQYAGSETDGLSVNYKQKYSAQQQVIKDNYAIFEVPYNGTDNNDYVDGQGFCCDDGSPEAAQTRALALENNFQDPDAYEKLQFYYHPDHLGSSSYITNLDGEVVQHIEYVPFGEVFIEERNSIWNTPYLFNAKEFDEETGLYYYGARYYDPRLGLFLSVDRYAEKYPNAMAYNYTINNPINLLEINGDSVAVLKAPKGAGGAGHMAILIQKENKKWALWSKNGTNQSSGFSGTPNNDQWGVGEFNTPRDFLQSELNPIIDVENNIREYTEAYVIPATAHEDRKAEEGAKKELKKDYFVFGSNCARTVQSALDNAGKKDGSIQWWEQAAGIVSFAREKVPNLVYKRIKKQNSGEVIKIK